MASYMRVRKTNQFTNKSIVVNRTSTNKKRITFSPVTAINPADFWGINRPLGLTLHADSFAGLYGNNNTYSGDGFGFFGNAKLPDGEAPCPELGTVLSGGHTVTTTSGLWRNVTDVTGPFGSGCSDMVYPEGFGNGGNNVYLTTENTLDVSWKQIYTEVMIKFSPNYVGHSNSEKFFYPGIFPTNSLSSVSLAAAPNIRLLNGDTPLGSTMSFQFNAQITGTTSEWLRSQENNPYRIVKGEWMAIASYARINTPGNIDGQLKVWVNGNLAVDFTDIRFSERADVNQYVFRSPRITGTRGGGVADTAQPEGGTWRRFNRVAVYGSDSF
jgi:hypothetical protein